MEFNTNDLRVFYNFTYDDVARKHTEYCNKGYGEIGTINRVFQEMGGALRKEASGTLRLALVNPKNKREVLVWGEDTKQRHIYTLKPQSQVVMKGEKEIGFVRNFEKSDLFHTELSGDPCPKGFSYHSVQSSAFRENLENTCRIVTQKGVDKFVNEETLDYISSRLQDIDWARHAKVCQETEKASVWLANKDVEDQKTNIRKLKSIADTDNFFAEYRKNAKIKVKGYN